MVIRLMAGLEFDTMRVSDWDDVQDVRAYGDY